MPRISHQIQVNVEQSEIKNGYHSWVVTVEARAEMFALADMLVKEGALRELDSALKGAAKNAVVSYLNSAKGFIKGAANKKRAEKKCVK